MTSADLPFLDRRRHVCAESLAEALAWRVDDSVQKLDEAHRVIVLVGSADAGRTTTARLLESMVQPAVQPSTRWRELLAEIRAALLRAADPPDQDSHPHDAATSTDADFERWCNRSVLAAATFLNVTAQNMDALAEEAVDAVSRDGIKDGHDTAGLGRAAECTAVAAATSRSLLDTARRRAWAGLVEASRAVEETAQHDSSVHRLADRRPMQISVMGEFSAGKSSTLATYLGSRAEVRPTWLPSGFDTVSPAHRTGSAHGTAFAVPRSLAAAQLAWQVKAACWPDEISRARPALPASTDDRLSQQVLTLFWREQQDLTALKGRPGIKAPARDQLVEAIVEYFCLVDYNAFTWRYRGQPHSGEPGAEFLRGALLGRAARLRRFANPIPGDVSQWGWRDYHHFCGVCRCLSCCQHSAWPSSMPSTSSPGRLSPPSSRRTPSLWLPGSFPDRSTWPSNPQPQEGDTDMSYGYDDTDVWFDIQDTSKLISGEEPITGRALAAAGATDITRTGLKVAAKVAAAEAGRQAATRLATQQASVTIPAVQAVLSGTATTETTFRLAEAFGKQAARSSLVSKVVGKSLGVFVAPVVAAVKLAMDDEEHDLGEYARVIGVKTAGSVVTLACSAAGPLGTVAGIGASIWAENQLEDYLNGKS